MATPPTDIKTRKPSRIRKSSGEQVPLIKDLKSEEQKRIEAAALAYVAVRDERMALQKQEREAKEKLGDTMKQAKRTEYKFDGYTVKLDIETKESLSVRRDKEAGADDE